MPDVKYNGEGAPFPAGIRPTILGVVITPNGNVVWIPTVDPRGEVSKVYASDTQRKVKKP